MAIHLPNQEEDELLGQINTTPLVDVMLVLLIIFLITIPVVTSSVPLKLPEESNHPQVATPQSVVISITSQGQLYLGDTPMADMAQLGQQLQTRRAQSPSLQVLVRGDAQSSFEPIGKVMQTVQSLGIQNISLLSLSTPPERQP
jgi:biopolymer transport protein ExbD